MGSCERAFEAAAEVDGHVLIPSSHAWLTQRGHLGLPPEAGDATQLLAAIYEALGGDTEILATAQSRRLRSDFVEVATGALVEVDESQHFTTARLLSLSMYPADQTLDYDALRDLAAPALGHPGVVRAPVIDRDGNRAWLHVRARLA